MELFEIVVTFLSVVKIPSIVLYIVVLAALIINRKELNSTFYDICISLGAADILYIIISTTHFLLKTYGVIVQWSPSAQMTYSYIRTIMWNGGYFGQLGGVLLLTANRFTAIMMVLKHRSIWSAPSTLVVAMCVQWMGSGLYTALVLGYPRYELVNNNGTQKMKNTEGFSLIYSTGTVIYVMSVCMLIIGMYLYMILSSVLQRKSAVAKVGPQQTDAQKQRAEAEKKLESRLTLFGMILGVCVFFYGLIDLSFFLLDFSGTPESMKPFVNSALDILYGTLKPFVDVVFTFSNPYLLLIFSSHVKDCVRKMFVSGGNVRGAIVGGRMSGSRG